MSQIVTDSSTSIGCSWIDFNHDGRLDLFVSNGPQLRDELAGQPNLLFANLDFASFSKISTGEIATDLFLSNGGTWGDYDNDGDLDLFVVNGGPFTRFRLRNNTLYSNNGSGALSKVLDTALSEDQTDSKACSWVDFDNDGDLDLFVTNLGLAGLQTNNFLFSNNGDGTFKRIVNQIVVTDGGSSFGCIWGDIDSDGDADLFVANISGENFLYANNGNKTFRKITTGDIVNDNANSLGGSFGDIDNDGDLDLFVANFDENNSLFTNNGDGTFTKVTEGPIVNDGGKSFGTGWADIDNDGDLDLFVANAGESNFLYSNNGDGSFERVTEGSMINDEGFSNGCSWGDFDNDGDLDLYIANDGGFSVDIEHAFIENNFMYVNGGNGNHWAKISCVGTLSNRSAIGTRIRLKATIKGRSVWQLREISGQTGFAGQNSLIAHFGLDKASSIDSIQIEWPSGYIWDTTNVAVNQPITVKERPFTRMKIGDETGSSCWGDYDNDGYIDVYVSGGQLYKNNGNATFAKITESPVAEDGGMGGSWGDYDNDGYLDLFVANVTGNNFLYANNRDGTFSRVTQGIVVNDLSASRAGSWGDFDNDGYLDLFVANDGDNFLYRGDPNGAFTKITNGKIVNDGGGSRSCNWVDYNGDGFLDVFVANGLSEENFMYANRRDGSFTKVLSGTIVEEIATSVSSSWGDFDNDRDLDLFVSNSLVDARTGQADFLYSNNDNGTFSKVTSGQVVAEKNVSGASCWGDFDNDGDLDLFVGNSGAAFQEPASHSLFSNNGDATFNSIATVFATSDDASPAGSGWADIDNDGDLDLLVGGTTIFLNTKHRNNWVNIKCIGTTSNSSAIGTKVRVKSVIHNNAVWQLRELSAQTGVASQNSLDAEFGLGDAPRIDSLTVLWSTGIEQVFTDISANQFLVIRENLHPRLDHTFQAEPKEVGQHLAIEATVFDESPNVRLSLNYRRGGRDHFDVIEMVDNNGFYQATIPGVDVLSQGVDYFIHAEDEFGLTARKPLSGIFSTQVRLDDNGVRSGRSQPNGSDQTAYRLISIPVMLDDRAPASIIEDDFGKYNRKKWRYFELLPNQTYSEFPGQSPMSPGKAFWLLVKDQGKTIDTGSGITNRTDKKYAIPLHPQWNFIGNPFNFPIPRGNLRLKNGDQPELFSFSGHWNDPITNPIPRIVPFEGYAIFNDNTAMDTLFVNPDLSVSGNSLAKRTATLSENGLSWSLRIVAQCQQAKDSGTVLGFAENASTTKDEMDFPEPPIIGEYVSVYFPHPEWQILTDQFSSDFRPETSEGEIWELEVKTNIRDKVHLTFEGTGDVPADLEIWLVDEVLGQTRNLREINSYIFPGFGEHKPKQLKLIVGRRNFVADNLTPPEIPSIFELSQNFPNPFNPVTQIRFGLPTAERVTLRIYNLLGKEVATLLDNEPKEAGYHIEIWDGRNEINLPVASGVYAYRVIAADFSITKKMVLVK